MINTEYNEKVDVERLSIIEDTNKKEFTTHLSDVNCAIQPLEPQISQDIDGSFGKDFLMFCEVVDIKEGDRIVRNPDQSGGGEVYRVTAVESLSFRNQDHMEIQIRIFE